MQIQNFRHISAAFICALALSLAFGLVASPTRAQSETTQMEDSFKKLSAEEEAKLRAIIAEPTRKDGLKIQLELQINEKYNAAKKLDDSKSLLTVRKEAAELFPNSGTKNNYARSLLADGQIEAGNQWMQAAIETATNDLSRAFYWSNVAGDFYDQNKNSEALIAISTSEKFLQTANRQQESQRREIERTLEKLNRIKSLLASRKGDFGAALRAAIEAETHARNAVKLTASNSNEIDKRNVHENLMSAIRRKLYAQNSLGKFAEVDVTLKDYLRLFQEIAYPPLTHARVLGQIAALQFDQRNFSQSEKFAHRGFEIGKQLNVPETSAGMLGARHLFALIFLGQHRYPEALAEFNKLDQLAGADDKIKARVRYDVDRAAVYLYNDMPAKAEPILAIAAADRAKRYGNDPTGRPHFLTAQAFGLQGVALWRIGTPESKAQAYPLLQNAVRETMAQDNTDYVNIGTRRELREMIFSTYIEAASRTNPADAMAALGIADWLRGGLVQEALGDAAVRAAASNDALSNLVRQDQDARNEIKGLRNYLSGEAGATASPLPQVAAQMRERIALLEKIRAAVQVKIKAAFPDYERLVRPLPPATADIQARLKADETLLVLQPTDDATYVWAISKDGAGSFYRANVTNVQLTALVKRLRTSLDVAGIDPSRRPVFDHAATQELYAKLLSPVQQGLAGKTSLIVAAGGVLGQIPFGVLETAAKDSWLIKQAAITHIPSVAAWLSMRALPHHEAAQPMLAWGDPLFNLAMASTNAAKGEVRKVVLTRASTAVDLEKEDPRSALKYANITPLPETRDELVAIAKTLGADPAKDLILGSAATRESVLAQNKNGELAKRRVVAFATHGLMAGDLPNLTQPALAMAGTKDDATNVLAPLLTLEDVLTLKLNADWVVLSACNTAAADGKAEEALSGLARGFFYAGSRSLLVTHWAVDSESAVTLTTETFKNYQSKPNEAKAESLRQAMLTVMNNPATAHPTYWAPYALVGDGAR